MLFKKINIAPEKKNVYLSAYIRDSDKYARLNRPAVVVLPGGGYMACSYREGEPVALRFAGMGYHSFVLQYSTLFSVFPEKPDLSRANPGVHYPGPMEDLGRAIIAIRENARRWCVDPDKIILCGFSAGAHLAAMYATHWNRPELSSALSVDASLLRPAACIYGYGVLDLTAMVWPGMNPKEKELFATFNYALCGKKELTREEIIRFSPVNHVGEHTPPAFIWTTAEDELVPCANSIRMAAALAEKNIPFELHVFEEGPHALSLADEATAVTSEDIYPRVSKWVPLAESWLKKRFVPELD